MKWNFKIFKLFDVIFDDPLFLPTFLFIFVFARKNNANFTFELFSAFSSPGQANQSLDWSLKVA